MVFVRASAASQARQRLQSDAPGRPEGRRLALDFDLKRPVNHDGRTQVLSRG